MYASITSCAHLAHSFMYHIDSSILQDKVEKDRLSKRRFGHIRHHCYYKNLMEPTNVDALGWLDPKRKEFWRTDVERVLKKDEEKRRARQKVLLAV